VSNSDPHRIPPRLAPLSPPPLTLLVIAVFMTVGCGVSELPRPAVAVPGTAGSPESPTPSGTGGSGAGGNPGGGSATGGSAATGGSGSSSPMASGGAQGAGGNRGSSGGAAGDTTDAGGPSNGSGSGGATGTPAGPPPSGITITINGTVVPKEKAIVLLHIGHSNMAGRAMGPANLMPYFYGTDPHLWRYQKGGQWTMATEPLAGDGGTPGYPQGAGPGMALLRTALAAAPDAYVISIGKGASLDFSASCFSFRKGGIFYDQVMVPALELKGKVTFAGLFAMFGYDGRSNPKAQSPGFINCLKGLAEDFRSDLGEPDMPFIQSDYERGATGIWSPTCCGAPQVIAQMAMVPAMIPRSVLIPTDGIPMQDNHHFNMLGHQQWAERVFTALMTNHLMPWAAAK
jgi:hypothetical protein